MIIPPEALPVDVFEAILEEYVNREGTDYGEVELSLAQKVDRLRPQVLKGDVVIVFDDQAQSVQLVNRRELDELE